jgi:nicotinate-nucleotide adenylyltransferase
VKVLLFGGSFDPPHIGHAALLQAAAQRIRPDRILVIPAYRAPLKDAHFATPAQRLRMARIGLLPLLAKRWRRITSLHTQELLSRRRAYTVNTVLHIRQRHPDWELHFVVGSDAASTWAQWRCPARLAGLCTWWTARRPRAAGRIPAHFNMLRRRMPAASSTLLRARLAAGQKTSPYLHPDTQGFILRHRLYGTALIEALRTGLKPGRFEHTLAVRRLAEALARRWQADPAPAAAAALLHDCGRLLSRPRQAAYIRRHRIRLPHRGPVMRRQPGLLHAYVGAHLARARFGCTDRAVLAAVRKHTLADRRMSRLDRILYVADAASEDRSHPNAARLRRLAFQDLNAAFRAGLSTKLRYALKRGLWLHPLSIASWNDLCART